MNLANKLAVNQFLLCTTPNLSSIVVENFSQNKLQNKYYNFGIETHWCKKQYNYKLSRGDICVANFKAPCEWCKFGQDINGQLDHLYKLEDWKTVEKWPMLKFFCFGQNHLKFVKFKTKWWRNYHGEVHSEYTPVEQTQHKKQSNDQWRLL